MTMLSPLTNRYLNWDYRTQFIPHLVAEPTTHITHFCRTPNGFARELCVFKSIHTPQSDATLSFVIDTQRSSGEPWRMCPRSLDVADVDIYGMRDKGSGRHSASMYADSSLYTPAGAFVSALCAIVPVKTGRSEVRRGG